VTSAPASPAAPTGTRRPGLDLLRGVAVLAMVLAHTTDSWTQLADRSTSAYRIALFIGGFGAPAFLFLAGVTQSLAAGARMRRGASSAAASSRALRHGVRIFALAFVFEIQSWVISQGVFWRKLTRVDILHIMGLAMCAGALIWVAARTPRRRLMLFLAVGATAALAAPVVMSWEGWSIWLPQAVALYVKPVPGRSIFTLLPWSAFFFFGAAAGIWLEEGGTSSERRQANLLMAVGAGVAVLAYGGSWLPSIYQSSDFWTTSPAFFFLRLGALLAAVGAASALSRLAEMPLLRQLGISSFFVYWIHVEMVYGVPSRALHQALPFWEGLGLWAVLCGVLALLVKAKLVVMTSLKARRGNGVKLPGQLTQSLMLSFSRPADRR
jgi:uncharacterized membrane protein